MAIDRTVVLAVNGMTCSHCVASVTEELKEVPGVENVEVILNTDKPSKVTVLTDKGVDDDAIREAIGEAGFELVSITRDF